MRVIVSAHSEEELTADGVERKAGGSTHAKAPRRRAGDLWSAESRLGDRDLEWKFLDGFRNRTKEDRWMWLQYLGYIASPGCVVDLARGFLEEPYQSYTGWSPFWHEYPKALREALPHEPTFWFYYGEEKGYSNMRAWVKDYLGIEARDEKPTPRDPQRSNPLSQSPPN